MADKNAKLGTLQQQGTLATLVRSLSATSYFFRTIFSIRRVPNPGQVRNKRLRRVQTEGQSVTDASANFGFSRPSFYQALSAFEQDGLAGLVPHKRGPKQAHKLTEEVLTFIGEMRQKEPSVRIAESGEADSGSLRYPGSSAKHRTQLAAPSKKTPFDRAPRFNSRPSRSGRRVRAPAPRCYSNGGPPW